MVAWLCGEQFYDSSHPQSLILEFRKNRSVECVFFLELLMPYYLHKFPKIDGNEESYFGVEKSSTKIISHQILLDFTG